MQAQADIGLIGLAVMGQNLVLNMNDHGFTVAVFNRTVAKVDDFLQGEAKGPASSARIPSPNSSPCSSGRAASCSWSRPAGRWMS